MLFRLSLVVISLIRVNADIFSDEDNLLQLKCPAETTDCFNEDDHRFPVLSEMIQSALALHEYKFQRFDQTVLRASPESRVYVMFQQSTGWVKDQTKQNGYYSGLMDAYYEARDDWLAKSNNANNLLNAYNVAQQTATANPSQVNTMAAKAAFEDYLVAVEARDEAYEVKEAAYHFASINGRRLRGSTGHKAELADTAVQGHKAGRQLVTMLSCGGGCSNVFCLYYCNRSRRRLNEVPATTQEVNLSQFLGHYPTSDISACINTQITCELSYPEYV